MKKFNKFTQKGFLALICAMILTIPNMKAYSSVGNYSINTSALEANNQYGNSNLAKPPSTWLPVLAAAGLAVVFVAGVVDGWNSVSGIVSNSGNEPNYDKNDFSKFDN